MKKLLYIKLLFCFFLPYCVNSQTKNIYDYDVNNYNSEKVYIEDFESKLNYTTQFSDTLILYFEDQIKRAKQKNWKVVPLFLELQKLNKIIYADKKGDFVNDFYNLSLEFKKRDNKKYYYEVLSSLMHYYLRNEDSFRKYHLMLDKPNMMSEHRQYAYYRSLCSFYYSQNEVNKALKYLQIAQNIVNKSPFLSNMNYRTELRSAMVSMYNKIGNYNKALEILYNDKEIGTFISDTFDKFSNIGKIYLSMQNFDSAFKYLTIAKKYILRVQHKNSLLQFWGNYATVLGTKGYYDSSNLIFFDLLKNYSMSNSVRANLFYSIRANYSEKKNKSKEDYQNLFKYSDSTLMYAKKSYNIVAILEGYRANYLAYKSMNDKHNALEYLILYSNLKDSIDILNNFDSVRNSLANYEVKTHKDSLDFAGKLKQLNIEKEFKLKELEFKTQKELQFAKSEFEKAEILKRAELSRCAIESEMELKKKQLLISEQKNKIKAQEIKQSKINLMLSILGGLIILAFGLIWKTRNYQLKKYNNELHEKNNQIQYLLKELNHRVKNNLQLISSMINLQSEKSENSEVIDNLSQIKNRLESISLIHQQLYTFENYEHIKFRDYLLSYIQHLKTSFLSDQNIEINTDIAPIDLSIDIAIPLGIITNEIFTNFLKYGLQASSPKISIELIANTDSISYSILENSSTFSDIELLKNSEGFGYKIISMLSKQINANLEIKIENGLNYYIKIGKWEK